ncbi:hypothetical protein [uncultured Methylobacterium sp.]|uniref:hypothetical protein n=1 Tax=uncultured Methylobacterium sp. TaxID=157278 RepID=UPI0035CBA7DF
MNDGLNSGADGAGEGDDLRSQLVAAFRDTDGGEVPAGATAPAEPAAPVAPEAPESAAAAAERARDPQGRFASKADEAAPATVAPAAGAPEAAPAAAVATSEAAAVRPPPGWSPAAKAAFETLPEAVRESVAKREAEVNQGFAKLAEFKGLDEFAAIAKSNGLTAGELAGRYQAAEKKLASNFVGGVHELCGQFRTHPIALAAGLVGMNPQAFVAALQAARGQGGAPNSPPAGAPPAQPQVHPEVVRLSQTVNGLVGERVAHQRAQAASVVEAFFADPQHPYAANLEAEILDLVSRDRDAPRDPQGALKRAYERAVYLNPETRQVVINGEVEARAKAEAAKAAEAAKRQSGAAANARSGMRSLTGSPVTGAAVTNGPAPTLRDELQRAFGGNRA